jgi:hypothetical protein
MKQTTKIGSTFPIKGRKKFVAPVAKVDNSDMDEIWKQKLGMIQNPLEEEKPNLYANKNLANNREQDLRRQMYGDCEPEPQRQPALVTHQASAKKEDMQNDDADDDGQFIMKMLAERRKKQQEIQAAQEAKEIIKRQQESPDKSDEDSIMGNYNSKP